MKRSLAILIAVIMMASIFAGCSMADKSEAPADGNGYSSQGKTESSDMEYLSDDSMPAPEPMANKAEDEYEGNGGGIYEEGRKAIKTGNAQIEVDNYQNAYEAIKTMIGSNGYIEESNIWKTPTYVDGEKILLTNGTLRIRIKAENFTGFTEGLSAIGTVLQATANEDDISDMYYDTEARLELKRDEKDRLEKYADSIEDPEVYFQIQSRITEVIYDIENLQGTLKRWDSKVEYATVYLTINEKHPDEESALPEPKGFFGKIWDNLKDGVSFLGDVIIFLAGALPILLVIAAVVIIIIIVIKKISRKPKPKPPVDKDMK